MIAARKGTIGSGQRARADTVLLENAIAYSPVGISFLMLLPLGERIAVQTIERASSADRRAAVTLVPDDQDHVIMQRHSIGPIHAVEGNLRKGGARVDNIAPADVATRASSDVRLRLLNQTETRRRRRAAISAMLKINGMFSPMSPLVGLTRVFESRYGSRVRGDRASAILGAAQVSRAIGFFAALALQTNMTPKTSYGSDPA